MTTSSHPQPPHPNFNRIARLYRWAEYLFLGPALQRTRTALLDTVRGCQSALLLGDGDGRFLARLLHANPGLTAHAVDTSPTMLALLLRRCQRVAPGRVSTQQASALDIVTPPGTDLVVTHFLLDCLNEPQLDRLVRNTAARLRPGALWLLSDFAVPPATAPQVWRLTARAYIRLLYVAFRLLTGLRVTRLPDPQAALTRHGFHRIARQTSLGGLLYTEAWALAGESTEPSAPGPRHNPPPSPTIHPRMATPTDALCAGGPTAPGRRSGDPLPNPEPEVPSLPGPDPGVFGHTPATRPPSAPPEPQPAAAPQDRL